MSFTLSREAEIDLEDIANYTAENWDKEQAAKYLRELNEKFVLIAENPLLNRERTELKQPIRIQHYESHIILYTTLNETVHIIRVLHQSMAIEER